MLEKGSDLVVQCSPNKTWVRMREILESDAKRRIRKRSIFLGFFVVQDGFKKFKIQRFSGGIISRGKVVQNIYALTHPPVRTHFFATRILCGETPFIKL